MLVAEFTKGTKRLPCTLTFNRIGDGRRQLVDRMSVKDKREARQLAEARNAVCWNF